MKKYFIILIAAIVLSFMFIPAIMNNNEDDEINSIDTSLFSEKNSLMLKTLNKEAGVKTTDGEVTKKTESEGELVEGQILDTSAKDLTETELEQINNGGVIIKTVDKIEEVEANTPFNFGNTTNEISTEKPVLSIGSSDVE